MGLRWIIATAAATVVACSPGQPVEQAAVEAGDVSFYPLAVQRLPDLSVPRGMHQTLVAGDEIIVLGGHTNGFRPLGTAEYYADGTWHQIDMLYTHDEGTSVFLPDGRIMIMGGCPEPFGIGQSWGAEVYDPVSHEFSSDCILDRKRTRSSALLLPDGRVLVSGNWYAEDALACFLPGQEFTELKPLSRQRTLPLMLPSSEDQVLIFGSEGIRGELLDGVVDRLEGDPFHEPLLDEWRVVLPLGIPSSEELRIASYTYLFVANRRADAHTGILKMEGEHFSVLDTDQPLPMTGIDGDAILWTNVLQVDRPARTAWIQGFDDAGRLYLTAIDYDAALEGNAASVKCYYAEISGEKIPCSIARMMPDGKFILAGGIGFSVNEERRGFTNFTTSASVFIFSPTIAPSGHRHVYVFIGALLLILLCAALMHNHLAPRRDSAGAADGAETVKQETDLLSRIETLMKDQEMFRRSDLKIADVATALGTNVTYVSACINAQAGVSFNEYILRYRIRYAQKLMKESPGIKIQQVGEDAGFANERSFFRSFKQVTSMTPGEWRSKFVSSR